MTAPQSAFSKREDAELRFISATGPITFEQLVNDLLSQKGWRVAWSDISIPDNFYWAMLIRSALEASSGQGE